MVPSWEKQNNRPPFTDLLSFLAHSEGLLLCVPLEVSQQQPIPTDPAVSSHVESVFLSEDGNQECVWLFYDLLH